MNKRILVVDDEESIRRILELNLTRAGYSVHTAQNGSDALTKLLTNDYDLLISDVLMPKMDGLEFLGRLMRLRPMPVVMISTLTERGAEVTMRALELGAVDFVEAPNRCGRRDKGTVVSNC